MLRAADRRSGLLHPHCALAAQLNYSNSRYTEGLTLSSTLSLSFTYAIGDKGQSDGQSEDEVAASA